MAEASKGYPGLRTELAYSACDAVALPAPPGSPMADDPRVQPLAEKMLSDHQAEHDWTSMTWQDYAADAVELLAVADKHDRWRALLADEDRAVELFRRAVEHRRTDEAIARAVLAALREVAGL